MKKSLVIILCVSFSLLCAVSAFARSTDKIFTLTMPDDRYNTEYCLPSQEPPSFRFEFVGIYDTVSLLIAEEHADRIGEVFTDLAQEESVLTINTWNNKTGIVTVTLFTDSMEDTRAFAERITQKEYVVSAGCDYSVVAFNEKTGFSSLCDQDHLFVDLRKPVNGVLSPAGTEAMEEMTDIINNSGIVTSCKQSFCGYELTVAPPYNENLPALYGILTEAGFPCAPDYHGIIYDPSLIGGPGDFKYYGDVNFDGNVTVTDARLILRIAIALDNYGSYQQKILADIDCDGRIDVSDARLCLRQSIGLDEKRAAEEERNTPYFTSSSVLLTKKDDRLNVRASVTCRADVTVCGFSKLRLQRLTDGQWQDLDGFLWKNIFTDRNSAVFSESIRVPKGFFYRIACEYSAKTATGTVSVMTTKSTAVYY